jgi:hypothetical protein
VRLCCLVVAAVLLAGCGARTEVPPGKVVGAIRSLGYDVRFRDLAKPGDARYLVGGRLRDRRTGTALDFAVMVGGDPLEMPIVPGVTEESFSGCAGAMVTATDSASGGDAAEADRLATMETRLEDALYALAPGATCEG